MKFSSIEIVLIAILTCIILDSSVICLKSENISKNKKNKYALFVIDFEDSVPSKWNRQMAGAYRNMAGLGYIEKHNMDEQMAEIAKGDKKNEKKVGFLIGLMFESQRWEHIITFTALKKYATMPKFHKHIQATTTRTN